MCISKHYCGTFHYEFLQIDETSDSDHCCHYLNEIKELINRECVESHEDNSKTHMCLISQQKLKELD